MTVRFSRPRRVARNRLGLTFAEWFLAAKGRLLGASERGSARDRRAWRCE